VLSTNWFAAVGELSSDYESLSESRAVLVLVSGHDGFGYFKVVSVFIAKYGAGAFFRLVLPMFLGR